MKYKPLCRLRPPYAALGYSQMYLIPVPSALQAIGIVPSALPDGEPFDIPMDGPAAIENTAVIALLAVFSEKGHNTLGASVSSADALIPKMMVEPVLAPASA